MITKRLSSLSYNSLLDIGPLRFVTNFEGNPSYTELEFLGNVYYYLTTPILIGFTSMQTGKSKYAFDYYQTVGGSGIPAGTNINTAENHIWLRYYYTTRGTEDLSNGIIKFGTPDFPLGYYEATFYQMADDTSTDPADAVKTLQKMIVYLYGDREGSDIYQEVEYDQYTDNDSNVNNIYQTNTYITP